MMFVLEYMAEGDVVGLVRIPGADCEEAIQYANDVLHGMNCRGAVLRWVDSSAGLFGAGEVLARYTPSRGWSRETRR